MPASHSNNHVFHQCFVARSRTTEDPGQHQARKWWPCVGKSKAIATLLLDKASNIVWRLHRAPNTGKRLTVYRSYGTWNTLCIGNNYYIQTNNRKSGQGCSCRVAGSIVCCIFSQTTQWVSCFNGYVNCATCELINRSCANLTLCFWVYTAWP